MNYKEIDYKEIIKSWIWRSPKVGFNQTTLAKAVGSCPSSISEYFNLKKDPSLPKFWQIENLLASKEYALKNFSI